MKRLGGGGRRGCHTVVAVRNGDLISNSILVDEVKYGLDFKGRGEVCPTLEEVMVATGVEGVEEARRLGGGHGGRETRMMRDELREGTST